MTEKELHEAEGVIEAIRAVMHITIAFNKMVAPVFIGGVVVCLPYVLLLSWISATVSAWGGDVLTAAILFVIMMVTLVPLAILTMGAVMIVEAWLPWDGFDP